MEPTESKLIRQSPKSSRTLNRRVFVQTSVAGAAGALGCSAAEDEDTYRESFETPVVAHHQVVVAGGGPSGLIAALAAARSGADTLLIERYAFLGGMGTAGLMTCYNAWRNQRRPEALQTVKGIPAEYVAELVRLDGIAEMDSYKKPIWHDVNTGDIPYTVPVDAEAAKIAALNLVRREGVRMRLHSWIVAPMLDGSRVTGVIVESKLGRQAITADIVVDCTGDGDIAAWAGAPFTSRFLGAPGPATGHSPAMSLMYQLGGLPPDIKGPYGGIRIGSRVVKWGPGFEGDGLDVETLTLAEVETRLKVWDQIEKLRAEPGMASVYLAQTATHIGVRETRHITGEYVVTVQDAVKGRRFPDVIAISSNPMPYRGERYVFPHEGFDIPYRSLVPQKVEGLVLAGRCISCQVAPFHSVRTMAPAMAVGHASGCAAAMASQGSVPPRELDVKALQKLLISQKAELRI